MEVRQNCVMAVIETPTTEQIAEAHRRVETGYKKGNPAITVSIITGPGKAGRVEVVGSNVKRFRSGEGPVPINPLAPGSVWTDAQPLETAQRACEYGVF